VARHQTAGKPFYHAKRPAGLKAGAFNQPPKQAVIASAARQSPKQTRHCERSVAISQTNPSLRAQRGNLLMARIYFNKDLDSLFEIASRCSQ